MTLIINKLQSLCWDFTIYKKYLPQIITQSLFSISFSWLSYSFRVHGEDAGVCPSWIWMKGGFTPGWGSLSHFVLSIWGRGVRYLDQGYLGGALKVSWQLPLVPEHILCFFLLKCHSCYMSDYPPNINLRCQDHASKCDNHLKALSSTKGQNLYTGSKIEGFNRWHGQIMQERMNKLVLRL